MATTPMTTGAAIAATGTEFSVDGEEVEDAGDVEAGKESVDECNNDGAGVTIGSDVDVELFWSDERLADKQHSE
jgi:hypothetical protein